MLDDLEAKQPNELVVNVTGQQFTWSFGYPAEKVRANTLVLPKDRPVEFRINTKDVIHDFWVPEFRLKSDAVPGLTTKIRLTPNRLGQLPGGVRRAVRPRPLDDAPARAGGGAAPRSTRGCTHRRAAAERGADDRTCGVRRAREVPCRGPGRTA